MNLTTRLNSQLMHVTTAALLWVAVAAAVSSCAWLQDVRDEKKGIQLQSLKAPPGYQISVLATGVPKARHMAMGERGTLFVGSSAGNVYALSLNGNVVTNQRIVIRGLTDPSGVAFHQGALYAADRTRIVRVEKIEERLDNPGPPSTVIDGLPDKARHGARALGFGPDGKLYVSVGSPCNTCEAKNDEYGALSCAAMPTAVIRKSSPAAFATVWVSIGIHRRESCGSPRTDRTSSVRIVRTTS